MSHNRMIPLVLVMCWLCPWWQTDPILLAGSNRQSTNESLLSAMDAGHFDPYFEEQGSNVMKESKRQWTLSMERS